MISSAAVHHLAQPARVRTWTRVTDWAGLLAVLPTEKTRVRIDGRLRRAFRSQTGPGSPSVVLYERRARAYGYRLHCWPTEWTRALVEVETAVPRPRSRGERYARAVELWAAYILRHTTPGVWDSLRTEALTVTAGRLRAYAAAIDAGTTYWHDALTQAGLPGSFEDHRTTTTRSEGASPHEIEQIRQAFRARQKFKISWRGSYDCIVSGDVGADGVYRGWLSTEFRDCGNGHYYLLLDGFHAIFAEDD